MKSSQTKETPTKKTKKDKGSSEFYKKYTKEGSQKKKEEALNEFNNENGFTIDDPNISSIPVSNQQGSAQSSPLANYIEINEVIKSLECLSPRSLKKIKLTKQQEKVALKSGVMKLDWEKFKNYKLSKNCSMFVNQHDFLSIYYQHKYKKMLDKVLPIYKINRGKVFRNFFIHFKRELDPRNRVGNAKYKEYVARRRSSIKIHYELTMTKIPQLLMEDVTPRIQKEFSNIRRAAVHARRIEYAYSIGIISQKSKAVNAKNAKLIQKWWRALDSMNYQFFMISRIQSYLRMRWSRKAYLQSLVIYNKMMPLLIAIDNNFFRYKVKEKYWLLLGNYAVLHGMKNMQPILNSFFKMLCQNLYLKKAFFYKRFANYLSKEGLARLQERERLKRIKEFAAKIRKHFLKTDRKRKDLLKLKLDEYRTNVAKVIMRENIYKQFRDMLKDLFFKKDKNRKDVLRSKLNQYRDKVKKLKERENIYNQFRGVLKKLHQKANKNRKDLLRGKLDQYRDQVQKVIEREKNYKKIRDMLYELYHKKDKNRKDVLRSKLDQYREIVDKMVQKDKMYKKIRDMLKFLVNKGEQSRLDLLREKLDTFRKNVEIDVIYPYRQIIHLNFLGKKRKNLKNKVFRMLKYIIYKTHHDKINKLMKKRFDYWAPEREELPVLKDQIKKEAEESDNDEKEESESSESVHVEL